MTELKKINPLLYITDHDPVPEEVLDASGWFETEYMTVQLGGKQEADIKSHEMLGWYLAQGWVVYNKEFGEDEEVVNMTFTHIKTVWRWTKFFLKRRKMQSERVLNDMIREFTEAYNEGRMLNDQRYDEIVALYNVMLDRSEDEANSLTGAFNDYDEIITRIIDGMPQSADDYSDKVDGLLKNYGDSIRTDVNIRFDNELAKARQDLISKGLFNSVIWTTTSSGIELLRSRALADIEDKITERKLAAFGDVQRIKMEISNRLEMAAHRLADAKSKRIFGASEFRNTILTAMLNFMERRTDEYPSLGDLAGIVSQIGYGEGGTVAPPA